MNDLYNSLTNRYMPPRTKKFFIYFEPETTCPKVTRAHLSLVVHNRTPKRY